MSKRKRDGFDRDKDIHDMNHSTLKPQPEQLNNSLEQGKKKLFQALKLARGFERQKLGRRQKTAKESNADIERVNQLNAEVSILKALDLFAIAEIHIYKSMIKAKAVFTAPGFPQYIVAKVESATFSQELAQANVRARLLSSNAVKTAMVDIMAEIGVVFGIRDDTIVKRKKRLRASDYATSARVSEEQPQCRRDIESPLENFQGTDKDNCSKPDEKSLDYKPYDFRPTDSPDNGSKSGDCSRESSARVENVNRSSSRDGSLPPSISPVRPVTKSPDFQPHKKSVPVTKSTTFIPSLTMGGYISDSESVESVASHSGNTDLKARKNRRGQHERRQIWEKKFGKNANHLKRHVQSQGREQGRGPRSVARRNKERSTYRKGEGQNSKSVSTRQRGGGPTSSGANSDPVKARAKPNGKGDSERPLHPSWEAAKKVKEAKRNVAFQGKKVVFN